MVVYRRSRRIGRPDTVVGPKAIALALAAPQSPRHGAREAASTAFAGPGTATDTSAPRRRGASAVRGFVLRRLLAADCYVSTCSMYFTQCYLLSRNRTSRTGLPAALPRRRRDGAASVAARRGLAPQVERRTRRLPRGDCGAAVTTCAVAAASASGIGSGSGSAAAAMTRPRARAWRPSRGPSVQHSWLGRLRCKIGPGNRYRAHH